MKVRKRFLVGITVTFLFLLALPQLVHPLTKQQIRNIHCKRNVPLLTSSGTYKIHPAKIIVQPWQGEHHVLGIFVVPDNLQTGHPGLLEIEQTNYRQVDRLVRRGTQKSGVKAPPGHYIVKVFIPTRAAIGLIATGKAEQLKQPCNWTLTYFKSGSL